MSKIAVMGGGAWGTALAASLARADHKPLLWARDISHFRKTDEGLENTRYLPGISLPREISLTSQSSDFVECETVLLVIPAQALRARLLELKENISNSATLVLCPKGIERETGETMSSVTRNLLPDHPIAVLSGPSFADDVARGLPTAVTLAADELKIATNLCELLSGPNFRPYASDDVTGVEWGGALKNVIALGVGMTRGRGLGASAEAALITRGFAELSRIARHFGAKPETLSGLSGFGDLVLTCSSTQSRNFSYGMAVGAKRSLEKMKLAEGVPTKGIVAKLCRENHIDAPIIQSIQAILEKQIDIDAAMAELFARPLKVENE